MVVRKIPKSGIVVGILFVVVVGFGYSRSSGVASVVSFP